MHGCTHRITAFSGRYSRFDVFESRQLHVALPAWYEDSAQVHDSFEQQICLCLFCTSFLSREDFTESDGMADSSFRR